MRKDYKVYVNNKLFMYEEYIVPLEMCHKEKVELDENVLYTVQEVFEFPTGNWVRVDDNYYPVQYFITAKEVDFKNEIERIRNE